MKKKKKHKKKKKNCVNETELQEQIKIVLNWRKEYKRKKKEKEVWWNLLRIITSIQDGDRVPLLLY